MSYDFFLDGTFYNEIHGWAKGESCESFPIRLEITSETGSRVEWATTKYRRDVSDAYQQQGLYGFCIPWTELSGLGRIFTISIKEDGQIIGAIELPEDISITPVQQAERRPTLIYLHIQKTAGTSIATSLTSLYSHGRTERVYPDTSHLSVRQFTALPINQRRALDIIVGHFHFGLDRFVGRRTEYATIIREPIKRVMSQYWHVRRFNKTVGIRFGELLLPLHVVVNEGLTEEFDNLQVRMIAGLTLLECPLGGVDTNAAQLALYNLQNYFAFYCDLDSIQREWPKFMQIIGKEVPEIERRNLTPAEAMDHNDPDFKKIDWDAIKRRHRPEIELYNEIANSGKFSG